MILNLHIGNLTVTVIIQMVILPHRMHANNTVKIYTTEPLPAQDVRKGFPLFVRQPLLYKTGLFLWNVRHGSIIFVSMR